MIAVMSAKFQELQASNQRQIDNLQAQRPILQQTIDLLNGKVSRASLSLMVLQELIDDVIVDVAFDCHRSAKINTPICHICGDNNCNNLHQEPGQDIFGLVPDVNQAESFLCDHCKRPVVASRFAPHLEKCMGLGRTSSRTRRTNNGTHSTATNAENAFEETLDTTVLSTVDGQRSPEDSDADEYVDSGEKKRKRIGRPPKSKRGPHAKKNGHNPLSPSSASSDSNKIDKSSKNTIIISPEISVAVPHINFQQRQQLEQQQQQEQLQQQQQQQQPTYHQFQHQHQYLAYQKYQQQQQQQQQQQSFNNNTAASNLFSRPNQMPEYFNPGAISLSAVNPAAINPLAINPSVMYHDSYGFGVDYVQGLLGGDEEGSEEEDIIEMASGQTLNIN